VTDDTEVSPDSKPLHVAGVEIDNSRMCFLVLDQHCNMSVRRLLSSQ